MTKFAGELKHSGIFLVCKSMQRFDKKLPTVYKKSLKCIGNNGWMSSPGLTFNLTCSKGVTELQNFFILCKNVISEGHIVA